MTSTNSRTEKTPGFWRDWFTRAGVAILCLIPIAMMIHDLLIQAGVSRSLSRPTELERLDALEDFAYTFGIYPGMIALALIVIGAARTLRRKKIFP